MKKIIIFFIVSGIVIAGCATAPKTEKTQLQIREFQTRTYSDVDSKTVMKAMLNVLQDDGFIVENAVPELGLLTATRELDVEDKGKAFWASFFAGVHARWEKNSIVEASCNVSDIKDGCKVRVNFQQKLLDNRGGIVEINQVDEQEFYQIFFNKVSKSIFIQRQGL
jgi:hypothetical protein